MYGGVGMKMKFYLEIPSFLEVIFCRFHKRFWNFQAPHDVAWFFFNFFSIVSSKNNLAKLFPVVFLIVKLAKSKNNLEVSISQKQSKNY
jgi:hypothetical protein